MPIESYRDLEVWQLARKLTKLVYQHSKKFPVEEKFGLSSQIRRAAVSIPSNVAEGWGRHYTAEFIQFLRRANGSLVEVETQLILSADLGFSTQQEVDGLLRQTQILGKKILNLERSLERRQSK
ncbi:MAG: four helix bundle protein [Verrucomicrobiota bacterium]|jgi:four helix bundle protein